MKLGYKLAFGAFLASNGISGLIYDNVFSLYALLTLVCVLIGGLSCDMMLEAVKDADKEQK